jgi:hypothetical protein
MKWHHQANGNEKINLENVVSSMKAAKRKRM